ncbi:hypothetical protein PLICRDRAFT_176527 [Plicaturopsis crispa FD-325 SS-3]|nr:hypothetical protein PLICRDRAFT_176527 [Plicaturopsis crispa FD-325 SS-3]
MPLAVPGTTVPKCHVVGITSPPRPLHQQQGLVAVNRGVRRQTEVSNAAASPHSRSPSAAALHSPYPCAANAQNPPQHRLLCSSHLQSPPTRNHTLDSIHLAIRVYLIWVVHSTPIVRASQTSASITPPLAAFTHTHADDHQEQRDNNSTRLAQPSYPAPRSGDVKQQSDGSGGWLHPVPYLGLAGSTAVPITSGSSATTPAPRWIPRRSPYLVGAHHQEDDSGALQNA